MDEQPQSHADALEELLREFESYQSMAEPVPAPEDIARMEREEAAAGIPPAAAPSEKPPQIKEPSPVQEERDGKPVQESDKTISPSQDDPAEDSAADDDGVVDKSDGQSGVESEIPDADLSDLPPVISAVSESFAAPKHSVPVFLSQATSGSPAFGNHKSLWVALADEAVEFIAGGLEKAISIPVWKRRFSRSSRYRTPGQWLNACPDNAAAWLQVYSSDHTSPVFSLGESPLHSRKGNAWFRKIESALQVALSDVDEGPLESSRIARSGHSALMIKTGDWGVICVFHGDHNLQAVNDLRTALEETSQHIKENAHDPGILSNPDVYQSISDWFDGDDIPALKASRLARTAVISSLLAIGGVQIFSSWMAMSRQHHFSQAVIRLEAEPGIVVVRARQDHDGQSLHLLRDPLASDPQSVWEHHKSAPPVHFHTEPYYSVEPEMAIRRFFGAFEPPSTAEISLVGRRLVITGVAPKPWIDRVSMLATLLPGIEETDLSNLKPAWSRDPSRIEGLSPVQLLESRILDLTRTPFLFETNDSVLVSGEQDRLNQLASEIYSLHEVAHSLSQSIQIHIYAHSTTSEYATSGLALSQQRARSIKSFLTFRGIPDNLISSHVQGMEIPKNPGQPGNSATIELTVTNSTAPQIP